MGSFGGMPFVLYVFTLFIRRALTAEKGEKSQAVGPKRAFVDYPTNTRSDFVFAE
ncbi:MAG: hypothetical protein ACLPX9_01510 [Rhodomicrobium sp.]